jgi:hypothetical protein
MGQYLDEDCVDLLKKTDSFLVPTLVTYDRIKRDGELSGMPSDQIAKVRFPYLCVVREVSSFVKEKRRLIDPGAPQAWSIVESS